MESKIFDIFTTRTFLPKGFPIYCHKVYSNNIDDDEKAFHSLNNSPFYIAELKQQMGIFVLK